MPASAQQEPAAPQPATPPAAAEDLRDVTDRIRRSEAELSRLRSEVAGLKGDRARLNVDLIKTGETVRAAEDRLAQSQARLDEVQASEAALRRSLEARRGLIIEVLAMLQRMGRKPPPAVLVRPEDMLEAIRSAILLGQVLPDIRAEAERLAGDLGELVRLREAAATERRRLKAERDQLEGERNRLVALVEARQGQIATSEDALVEEKRRLDAFARQAQSLKELISRAEAESATSQRAQELAKKVPPLAKSEAELAALATAAFRDPARLQPKIAFPDARGLLLPPTNGPIVRAFGVDDGFGGTERGVTIAAAVGNLVTAPADGWVLFSGPYRSYGRVLIINVGNGYTFVLTGLQTTNVETGQFVLAREPVGTVGPVPSEGAAQANSGEALLYVELRKDNLPVDSSPWWAKQVGEKARG